MRKAYLLGLLQDTTITEIMVCSEPPWGMTKRFGDEYIIILETEAHSFQEAVDWLRRAYPRIMRNLSKHFPFPEP